MDVKQILEQSKIEVTETLEKNKLRRKVISGVSLSEFTELLKYECQKILIRKGEETEFIIDKVTERIIETLFLYICKSDKFPGNLNKGILLAGGYGVGKTIIMTAFSEIFFKLTQQRILVLNSTNLSNQIKKNGFDDFITKPILIDELGREQIAVKNYGTEVLPIIDLIAMRSENGAWTFGTTNYKLPTLTEKYGQYTTERLIELFNFIEFNGKSKRK